jgi:hypothetical protein
VFSADDTFDEGGLRKDYDEAQVAVDYLGQSHPKVINFCYCTKNIFTSTLPEHDALTK